MAAGVTAGEHAAGDGAQEWMRAGRRLAEEGLRLLDAAQRSAIDHQGPDCRRCPVCQGIAAVRRVRPEAVERLADVLSDVATALRDTREMGGAGESHGQPPSRHPEPVQYIDISD